MEKRNGKGGGDGVLNPSGGFKMIHPKITKCARDAMKVSCLVV